MHYDSSSNRKRANYCISIIIILLLVEVVAVVAVVVVVVVEVVEVVVVVVDLAVYKKSFMDYFRHASLWIRKSQTIL